MAARIYRPAKTALQSGKAKTEAWMLEFEPEQPRRVEPLMGYTSSGDMKSQIHLSFETREEAIALFRKNTDEVTAELDVLTPELIESTIATPGLSAPMTFFMNLPTLHAQAHAAQIDYLQTCWGDQEVHL